MYVHCQVVPLAPTVKETQKWFSPLPILMPAHSSGHSAAFGRPIVSLSPNLLDFGSNYVSAAWGVCTARNKQNNRLCRTGYPYSTQYKAVITFFWGLALDGTAVNKHNFEGRLHLIYLQPFTLIRESHKQVKRERQSNVNARQT